MSTKTLLGILSIILIVLWLPAALFCGFWIAMFDLAGAMVFLSFSNLMQE